MCVVCVCVKMREKLGEKEKLVQIAGGACPFHLHVVAKVFVQA